MPRRQRKLIYTYTRKRTVFCCCSLLFFLLWPTIYLTQFFIHFLIMKSVIKTGNNYSSPQTGSLQGWGADLQGQRVAPAQLSANLPWPLSSFQILAPPRLRPRQLSAEQQRRSRACFVEWQAPTCRPLSTAASARPGL